MQLKQSRWLENRQQASEITKKKRKNEAAGAKVDSKQQEQQQQQTKSEPQWVQTREKIERKKESLCNI